MSALGLFHTGVSLLSLGSGAYAFWRDGEISSRTGLGKFYLGTMYVASLTAFGIFSHGTFGVGHVLSLITLAVLLMGQFAQQMTWLGWAREYVETVSYSMSYLMLMVFATTETLTRLPVGHPIASGPDAHVLGVVRLVLLAAFAWGLSMQLPKLRTVGNAKHA